MIPSPETVLFAIQAGLKLYAGVRKAYVDSTRGRALTFPLPRAPDVSVGSARTWFRGDGKKFAERSPRVQWLINQRSPTPVEEGELLDTYLILFAEANPTGAIERSGLGLNEEDLDALLTIRQWSVDEPGAPRSPLQQVAGTIVEIVVDYFANTPGAVSQRRPAGRLLLAFLRTIDDIDLSEAPPKQIVGDILVGILDGVTANPDLFGGGGLEQEFVAHLTASLAGSARRLIATNAPSQEIESAGQWLQLVARAVVDAGAKTVLENPVRFLKVDEGQAALIQAVGGTLAELLLADEHRVRFRAVLSGDGLLKVAQSALGAVASNPTLLKADREGLKAILVALAGDLARYDAPFTDDFFPELARLLLDRTAENLDLVWGARFTSPDRHLLVTATRSILKALARKPKAGSAWRPTLTSEQVLEVLEDVFDEVIDNPGWLVARAEGASDALGAAVEAMLAALRGFDGSRLSADAGITIFRAGILSVGRRITLLDQVPPGSADEGRVLLTALVEIVIGSALGSEETVREHWNLARSSTLTILVEIVLDEAARRGIGPDALDDVRQVMTGLVAGEFSIEEFRDRLVEQLTK